MLVQLKRNQPTPHDAIIYNKSKTTKTQRRHPALGSPSYDVGRRLQGEIAGNGLVTRKEFDPYNGQLNRITTGIEGQ